MSNDQNVCTRCGEAATVKLSAETKLIFAKENLSSGDVWDAERGYPLCDDSSNMLTKIVIPSFLRIPECNLPNFMNRMGQTDYQKLQDVLTEQLAKCDPK